METKSKLTFKNVDEYLTSQPYNVRSKLYELRQIIKKAAPDAEEVISYQMPGYKLHGMLVWFAGYKNHCGFYPTSTVLQVFKDQLAPYELSKGTIRFPIEKPLPVKLISEIVKFRVKENLDKKLVKDAAKRSKTRG